MGYILLIIGIFLTELQIKNYIEKNKTEDIDEPALKNRILIRKFHNKGALLNIGNKKRKMVAAISLAFSFGMIVVFILSLTTRGNHMFKLGMALLLGGAFSNTYDRLKRKYVVDYFSFQTHFPRITAIVFNISDFCIAVGAAIAAIVVILNPDI